MDYSGKNKKGGFDVGLFGFLFGGSKKKKLLEMQRIVLKDSPGHLIMSEAQLKRAAMQQAQNDLRIIKDCISLISKTEKPDVFFSRLDLLEIHSKHLMELEPYISFSGASPKDAYKEIVTKKDECIRQFLVRYCTSVKIKADAMKTEKGKTNKYIKSYENLQPYFSCLSDRNKEYVSKMLNKK